MANSLLTPTQVTREALRILHQKLNFIGSINRQYDDSFAQSGAKIGDSLKIRLPNQYTVRSGATLSPQDTAETSVTLQVATQKGVDLNFSSVELTLSLDDFSRRILEPAMSVLAANIEFDAMSMYRDVYQQVDNHGAAASFAKILQGRKILGDALAPPADRACNLNTQDNVDLVDALKGLFQDGPALAKQYREGYMGRSAGFDFMENTLWPGHARGAGAGYLVNGAGQTGSALVVDTGSGAISAGDVFTIAGVFRVHPETKASTGVLQQFVVTAPAASGTAGIAFSPAIVTTGAGQNVNAAPADNAAITFAGPAGTAHGISMAYHQDAFAFATADLVMPKGVDFAAREVFDGISLRIVRQYDINADKFPCRLDVLYGYRTVRPQLACRLANR
ncbi:P22 phage major capsid protein family protein [Arenibaculum pallidiluteum]|uniref:P22 phage major capsid protein family protein n=1 Tax=Arenibaculum pallidiluteum TaxID=2812559 RepID=UPI001A96654C|nr:P22 phage major capsid protein family protein [Arenibaculum pallidiluteum]